VRALAKEAELKAEAPSRASFDQARSERDQSCKMDVGNQVLRAALAKLGMVAGNFERAKKEKNVVTQVVAATTGISPDAIAHNGPLGGEHSVARQAVNAVVGGLNGAIRKGISDAGHFLGIRQQQSDHVHINPAGTSFVVPPGLSWPLRLNLRSISQCVSNRPQLAMAMRHSIISNRRLNLASVIFKVAYQETRLFGCFLWRPLGGSLCKLSADRRRVRTIQGCEQSSGL
jgi:hypothetical protein